MRPNVALHPMSEHRSHHWPAGAMCVPSETILSKALSCSAFKLAETASNSPSRSAVPHGQNLVARVWLIGLCRLREGK